MIKNESKFVKEIQISALTPDKLRKRLYRFFELESEWTNTRQRDGNEEQCVRNLPCKWELSFVAEINDLIVGYVIGSQDKNDEKMSRVNKIVIDRNYHRQGISKKLMYQYFEASVKQGMNRSELTAMSDYTPANKLYISLGYKQTSVARGKDGETRNIYVKKI